MTQKIQSVDVPTWASDLRSRLRLGARTLAEQRGERRAAVLIPLVRKGKNTPEVLLVRRSRALRAHPGQYAFPGGTTEPGDSSLVATAVREAGEEIGLGVDEVTILGRLPDVRTPTGYLISPFIGLVEPARPLQPSSPEIAFVLHVPTEYIVRAEAFTTVRRRARGLLFTGDALVWDGHEVWGATARMLLALRRLLRSCPGPWLQDTR